MNIKYIIPYLKKYTYYILTVLPTDYMYSRYNNYSVEHCSFIQI